MINENEYYFMQTKYQNITNIRKWYAKHIILFITLHIECLARVVCVQIELVLLSLDQHRFLCKTMIEKE